MDSRGELTSTQLALLILSVVGFIVLLYFVTHLGIQNYSPQEACHLSVITRATVPDAAQTYIPLKCTTQKICLRDGTGNCAEAFAGDNPDTTTLDSLADKASAQIAEQSAQAMYDCWKTMGEGKLDLFQSLSRKSGLSANLLQSSDCVICSRISIDSPDRAKQLLGGVDLPQYLQSHEVPGTGMSYLQAFTDKSLSTYAKVPADLGQNDAQGESVSFDSSKTELAVVFMQIKTPKYKDVLSNLATYGATAAVGSFVILPRGVAGGAARLLLVNPIVTLGAGAVSAGAVAGYAALNVYSGGSAAAGRCGEVTVPGPGTAADQKNLGDSASTGCSMVAVVPYDAKAINKMCSFIESAP